jgi:hypothetical protein
MRARKDLPAPEITYVRSRIRSFDDDNCSLESGLVGLIGCFPKNEDLGQILVKVAAINSLYNTRIWGIAAMANVIARSGLDTNLESGSDEAVRSITKVEYSGKPRLNYSFASKYCSWHNRELFPIYDSRVDFCLRSYAAKDHFAKFTQEDLWDYGKFRGVMIEFRNHYHLELLTFKELDKFLYQLGNAYFTTPESALDLSHGPITSA